MQKVVKLLVIILFSITIVSFISRSSDLAFLLTSFLSIIMFTILQCIRINGLWDNDNKLFVSEKSDTALRKAALAEAKIFLAPYKNIWKDLRLSNKYCSLILGHDGITIKCIEKVKPYRKLQVINSNVHSYQELWNMFCIYFSYNKSYDGVLEDCQRYHVSTIESGGDVTVIPQENNKENNNLLLTKSDKKSEIPECLDINNCSEIELTELPGVSIVLAKKAIKKREEIGGFKSVDEFLKFINLKPHMENQLKNRIKVEKMKGSINQKRYSERSVDF